MHRKNFLLNTGILTAGSLFFKTQSFANFFGRFDYTVKMLRNNVGIFLERGGSIGFMLSNDGNVVIDSQFPDTAAHLMADIQKRNSNPFKYLLNTHHHGDHSGGNIAFKGIAEHVMAHENSLKNQKNVAEKNKTEDKQLYPNMTFSEDWKLKLGKEKIKGYYFGAAHTNGDAVYHMEDSNIMHVGDLMFNKRHPYVDRSAGANISNWIQVLDKIIKKADKDTLIIFGHSLNPGEETGNIENLKKFQGYLGNVLAFAKQEINKGVSKENFIKSIFIPGVTEWGGTGMERPLTAAYEEVMERKKGV
ncbi:MAG: MBL fold metallo-hydrolase [Flavisolibacter sp.]